MNTYLLILHENLDTLSSFDEEKMNGLMNAHMQWAEKLGASGSLIAGEGLDDNGIIIDDAKMKRIDSPKIDNGYMVGGYYLIKAKSLDDAFEISKDCPCHLWGGKTEIRAIADYS